MDLWENLTVLGDVGPPCGPVMSFENECVLGDGALDKNTSQ